MPRFDPKAVFKPLPATLILIGAAALASFLYVILSGPVHAVADVPPALSRLHFESRPHTAPDMAFADAKGQRHMLDQFRGHYLLVNLWATWCSPCVRELPALARLKAALAGDQLKVVAVNVGHADVGTVRKFLKAHHAQGLGVWRDPDHVFIRGFDAYGLPTSILIDPSGQEIARVVGTAAWDAPAAIAYFRALLKSPSNPLS